MSEVDYRVNSVKFDASIALLETLKLSSFEHPMSFSTSLSR
jgi:hypothetical protein